jgi:hypothetical protein
MSNVDFFMCACGSGFSSSANMKRHKKLCAKANDPVYSMSNIQLTSAVSRIEAKMDMLLQEQPITNQKFDITSTTPQIIQPTQPIKIISSKPSITFEELCMKDFSTARNAMKLEQFALEGKNGIVSLFQSILSKYKVIPFKYIHKPTKKAHHNEGMICKFEDNIVVYKDKSWLPMTRDDTNEFFYNLYIALENNYSYPQEDDDKYDETLDKFYKDITEYNIYSNVVVEIKDELIDIIKTLG